MIVKNLFSIAVIVLWATCVFGQQKAFKPKLKVTYDMFFQRPQHAVLYANDTLAYYVHSEKPLTENGDDVGYAENGLTSRLTIQNKHSYAFLTYAKQGKLYSQSYDGDLSYFAIEKRPHLKWKLGTETKTFGGVACRSAEVDFRGRHYRVWYAPSIPLGFGPWKLGGLPGLILAAKDDTNEVLFTATKIEMVDSVISIPDIDYFEVVELAKAVEKNEAKINAKLKAIRSRLPKGGEISSTSIERLEQNYDDLKQVKSND